MTVDLDRIENPSAIAAAEVSVGLALIVWAYRQAGSVDPENYNILK